MDKEVGDRRRVGGKRMEIHYITAIGIRFFNFPTGGKIIQNLQLRNHEILVLAFQLSAVLLSVNSLP